METRTYTYKELQTILKYLGRSYKLSKQRIKNIQEANRIEENYRIYDDDTQFVHVIEEALLRCGEPYRTIIENDFLYDTDKKWYLSRFARSSYYRYKQKAVKEFLNHLGDIKIKY